MSLVCEMIILMDFTAKVLKVMVSGIMDDLFGVGIYFLFNFVTSSGGRQGSSYASIHKGWYCRRQHIDLTLLAA